MVRFFLWYHEEFIRRISLRSLRSVVLTTGPMNFRFSFLIWLFPSYLAHLKGSNLTQRTREFSRMSSMCFLERDYLFPRCDWFIGGIASSSARGFSEKERESNEAIMMIRIYICRNPSRGTRSLSSLLCFTSQTSPGRDHGNLRLERHQCKHILKKNTSFCHKYTCSLLYSLLWSRVWIRWRTHTHTQLQTHQ